MKLIIQIPCFNEEKTLKRVIDDLPDTILGVDRIEYLVIDDGSTDQTIKTAHMSGVHHVVSLGSHRGLGTAFLTGIQKCLALGADVIVNTDGDNQYKGSCIHNLVQPIIKKTADIVIGTRPIEKIEEFSWIKKMLQRFGSFVARRFSGTNVPDTTSGFRSYTRDAAMRLHLLTDYSHTLETIIQAGQMNMRVAHVPIQVNPQTRDSRLITSTIEYIMRSIMIILRSYIRFRPLHTFIYLSILPGLTGLVISFRFLYFYFTIEDAGHTQSLILAAILILIAFFLIVLGILADLIGSNRKLNQEILYLIRCQAFVKDKESQAGFEGAIFEQKKNRDKSELRTSNTEGNTHICDE